MSQEYREGQLVVVHCCLGPRGWKSLAMKNGKDGWRAGDQWKLAPNVRIS